MPTLPLSGYSTTSTGFFVERIATRAVSPLRFTTACAPAGPRGKTATSPGARSRPPAGVPGATPAQVRTAWGPRFGRCRRCAQETWYYNYTDFRPQGVGLSLRRGRVDALFTIWTPPGWHTSDGLTIGDRVTRITELYGPLAP